MGQGGIEARHGLGFVTHGAITHAQIKVCLGQERRPGAMDGDGQALDHLMQVLHPRSRRTTVTIGGHHEKASEREMGWQILRLQFQGALQRLARLKEKVAFF